MIRREDPDGETERMQARALSLANSVGSDLLRMPSHKRTLVLLTRCEELTRVVRELSAALR